jgi:hypothetical protein
MKKLLLLFLVIILFGPPAFEVPTLKLFVDGATYDWGSQTWVVEGGSFDLYVVSANEAKSDVIVSLALGGGDDPADLSATFGGNPINQSSWVYGYAPLDNVPEHWNGGNDDLPRHGIFPTWFTEVHTGAYNTSGYVGDVQPNYEGDFWNPATGNGSAPAIGQVKMFHIEVGGTFSYIHFDAYTLNSDGTVNQFAPFSHDAEATFVPEPGTLALMGTGLFGLGLAALRKRKT